jgi:hypothetical protein
MSWAKKRFEGHAEDIRDLFKEVCRACLKRNLSSSTDVSFDYS